MGLTIHYSGSFNKSASLSGMIEEVKDIAEIYKWEYCIFEKEFPSNSLDKKTVDKKIYGICFTPPGCETVNLCFLSNGKMSCYSNLKFYGDSDDKIEQQYLYMLSTKTQYAGIDTHKLIVHLLKHLNKKYFVDFKVIDEGEYWEGGDEKLLQKKFKQYNDLIESVSSALETHPINPGETFEEYFTRILKEGQRKNKNTD